MADLCHFGLPDWLGGSFQNPDWPPLFAQYAAAFARRYPWVRLYTPVNEVFICAQFSARNGWWNERLKSELDPGQRKPQPEVEIMATPQRLVEHPDLGETRSLHDDGRQGNVATLLNQPKKGDRAVVRRRAPCCALLDRRGRRRRRWA